MAKLARALPLLLAIAVTLFAWVSPLERVAVAHVDAGLQRALVSFASARALNAAISVAQGTEVSVQPMGLGVNFAPGQLLDPINDVVEQFADWMMAASIAFGIQKVLIELGAYWVISLLLAAVAIGWACCHLAGLRMPSWLPRLLLVLLIVRFAVPLAALASNFAFERFLAEDYRTSQRAIESATGQVGELEVPLADPDDSRGLLDRMQAWWSSNSEIETKFEQFRVAAEQSTQHIVKVIVIFLLETLVLPILMLGALYAVLRSTLVTPQPSG